MLRKIIIVPLVLILWGLAFLEIYSCVVALIGGASFFDSLGQALYKTAPESLNLAQALVQRYTFPFIWDSIFVQALLRAIWLNLLVSIALVIAGWLLSQLAASRKRRHVFRK